MFEGLDVVPPVAAPVDDTFIVAIDPGHGGIDPGASARGWSRPM